MKHLPEQSIAGAGSRKKVCITDYLNPLPVPSFKDQPEPPAAPASLEEAEPRRDDSQPFSQPKEKTDFDIFQFLHENLNVDEAEAETGPRATDPVAGQVRLQDLYRVQREVKCFCAATTLDQPNAVRKARSAGLLRYHQYLCADNEHDDANAVAFSSLLEEFDGDAKNEFHLAMNLVEALGLRSQERAAALAGLPLAEVEKREQYLLVSVRDRESLVCKRLTELDVPLRTLEGGERGFRMLASGAGVFFVLQALFDLTFTSSFCSFCLTANFAFCQATTQQAGWDVAYLPYDAEVVGEFLAFDAKVKDRFVVEPEELAPRAAEHMEELAAFLDKHMITLRPGLFGRLLESHLKFLLANCKQPRFLFSC